MTTVRPVSIPGIPCPRCGSKQHGTLDSRPHDNTTRRKRKCRRCEEVFYTYEFNEVQVPSMERSARQTVQRLKGLAQRMLLTAEEGLNDE